MIAKLTPSEQNVDKQPTSSSKPNIPNVNEESSQDIISSTQTTPNTSDMSSGIVVSGLMMVLSGTLLLLTLKTRKRNLK